MKNLKLYSQKKIAKSAIERLMPGNHQNPDIIDDLNFDLNPDKDSQLIDASAPASSKRRKAKFINYNKKPIGLASSKRRNARPTRKRSVASPILPKILMLADTSPEMNDYAAKGLWDCHSVEEVEDFVAKGNRAFKKKVRDAVKLRKIDDQMRARLDGLFDGTTTSSTIMTNDRLRSDAWHHLHSELVALVTNAPDVEVAFVTIIAGTGGTSHAKPNIGLYEAQVTAQTTLRAMSPNFFGISEFAMFNSMSHPDGGQHLQEHTHALVFGEGVVKRALEVAAKHMDRFTPNATDAPQIDVRSVDTDPVNLARICAYLFKAPIVSRGMV